MWFRKKEIEKTKFVDRYLQFREERIKEWESRLMEEEKKLCAEREKWETQKTEMLIREIQKRHWHVVINP